MSKMATIQNYLENVVDKKLDPNFQILFNLQVSSFISRSIC